MEKLMEDVLHTLTVRAKIYALGMTSEKNVSRQYMATLFKTNERKIREAIELLRDEAVYIISSCDDKGYYIGSEEEFNNYNVRQKLKHTKSLQRDLKRERAILRRTQRERHGDYYNDINCDRRSCC